MTPELRQALVDDLKFTLRLIEGLPNPWTWATWPRDSKIAEATLTQAIKILERAQ